MTSAGANRVYFHVGCPKTGTTYLQEVLWNNRDALAKAGVLFPGRGSEAHFRAAMDLQEKQFQGDWVDNRVPGAWNRVVEQARGFDGSVVLSHELFCTASPEQIKRALSDLSFAEVHLVCTARDLARQLPAVWQEDVKNRHTLSFTEFAEGVRGDREAPHFLSKLFWARQDLPAILAKWSVDIPPERVHVVTVPPAGGAPDLIWRRFAQLVGIDADAFDTTVKHPNRSLGVAETELVRRLNGALHQKIDWPKYDRLVKYDLSARTFGARKARSPIGLSSNEREWLYTRAKQAVADLDAANYDVVGDLTDLLPEPADEGAVNHPDSPDEHEVLDVALEALAATLQRAAELQTAVNARPAKPTLRHPRLPRGVRQSVIHLFHQHRLLKAALGLYRRAKAGVTERKT